MSTSHEPRIDIKLIGAKPDCGLARLDDFVSITSSLQKCLREIERCITGNKPLGEYRVTDLACKSASVSVEPIQDRLFSAWLEVPELFLDTVNRLQGGNDVDKRLDDDALTTLRMLFSPNKRHGASVLIGATRITEQFVKTIDRLVEPAYTELGSLSGRLDSLDAHDSLCFAIYPVIGNAKVRCEVQEDMFENVRAALKKMVTVYGVLKYAKDAAFPKTIEVNEIEVHPDASELPSLPDLFGTLAPTLKSKA